MLTQFPGALTSSISGIWYYVSGSENVTTDICFNQQTGTYELSYYSSSGDIEGYGVGFIEPDGIRGEWYTATGQGVEFYRLNDSNTMISMYWPFNYLQQVQYLPCDDLVANNFFSLHGQHYWTRISTVPNTLICASNNALIIGVPNPPFTSPSPTPSVQASQAPLPTQKGSADTNRGNFSLVLLIITFVLPLFSLLVLQ